MHRAQLYYEVRKLVNNRELDSTSTYDGKIIVKTHKNRKITIETEEDFWKLESFIESPNVRSPQELDDFLPLTSTPAANRVYTFYVWTFADSNLIRRPYTFYILGKCMMLICKPFHVY